MQTLRIKVKARHTSETVLVEFRSDGTVRLPDLSKFMESVLQFLKGFERAQTGNRAATRQWDIVEMKLDETSEEKEEGGDTVDDETQAGDA